MKIFLISSNTAKSPYPVYPLGMGMVASALLQAGHDVDLFDFLCAGKSMNAVCKRVKEYQPDIIGISIRNIDNSNMLNEQKYINIVKEIIISVRVFCKAPIIIGGTAVSILPEVIIQKTGADFGIVGEGETLIVEFADNFAKGRLPEQKILYASLKLAGKQIPSAEYNSHLMNFYLKNGKIASVQTKRGCPHKCIYCSYPNIEGSLIRCRDFKDVVDDIEVLLNEHKAKQIFFTDSVFNDDKGFYLEIVKEMKRREISVPWTGYFKPKGLTEEYVDLMKQTGLEAAEIGADASTDQTLRKLGKSFLFKDILETNKLFATYNIAAANFYIFGGPGETEYTVLQGIENIKSLERAVSLMFMGIRILPNTALQKIAEQENIISKGKDLLNPVYYISPKVDKDRMERNLTDGFKGMRNCIFPPDKLDSSLQLLHKMGYSGSGWNMLLPQKNK